MQNAPADSGAPAAPARSRRNFARAFVVLASICAFLAVFSLWVNRQFLNTDGWTTTSSRMIADPVIRARVGAYLVDQLYANVNVAGEIRSALPAQLQPLAGPAAGGLHDFAENQIDNLLSRPQAQTAWEGANRQAHQLFLEVLQGGGSGVSTHNGAVVLNLKTILTESQQRIGLGGRLAKVLPAGAAQVEVLRSDQLKSAQTAFRILKPLPIVLIGASLLLFGAALAVSPGWRRKAVRAYGIGFVAAGVGALVARNLLGSEVVNSIAHTQAMVPTVEHVWTFATSLLDQAAVATIAYGVLMVAGAWLAGPTLWAVAVRRKLAPYLREPAITYGALAVILAIVILWWSPTPATRNPVTALVLVALVALGVEGLRRQTAREFPDADRHIVAARRRERMLELYESFRRRAGLGTQAVARQASSFATSASDQIRTRRGGGGTEQPPTGRFDRLERLERLSKLREAGVLDEAEFNAEKARVMADSASPAP